MQDHGSELRALRMGKQGGEKVSGLHVNINVAIWGRAREGLTRR